MANKQITSLTELTNVATNDEIPIYDVSAGGEAKKITQANLVGTTLAALDSLDGTAGILKQTGADTFTKVTAPSGAVVGTTDSQTLTNKTIDGDDNTLTDIPAANLKIASQATGDILYASSASAWSRLAVGAATTFLKGGATPSFSFAFSRYKVGSTTYDTSTTGSLAVTGVGFQPKLLILFGSYTGGSSSAFSVGFTDGTSSTSMHQTNAGNMHSSSEVGVIWTTYNTVNAILTYASFDSDGFTLTKAKNGSPTGTATVTYICLG